LVLKQLIEDFRFHDLRHSFASRLVMKKASIKAVQDLLGHKDIKMTMRYTHLADDVKKDAVKLLDGDIHNETISKKKKKD
jgi:integrase